MSACSSSSRPLAAALLLWAATAAAQVGAPPLQFATNGTGVCYSPWRVDTASSEMTLVDTGGSCAQGLSANVTMLGPVVGDVASEVVFFDGGTTDQTCGVGNEGRHRVLDSGYLQYCDGNTSTLRKVVENDLFAILTNKWLDTETTTNTIWIPVEQWFPVATCAVSTPSSPTWNTTSATAPQPVCTTGTATPPVQDALLAFDGASDECIQRTLVLPTTFTTGSAGGGVDVTYKWNTTATTGSVTWCSQFTCVADAESNDATFPGQTASNCVSDVAKGTASQMNDATDTALTITGCVAGEMLHWRLCRDPDSTAGLTDDITADANLLQVMIRWRQQL